MSILSLLQNSPSAAITFLISIIVAITVHEFAHAWTAYHLGDDTPYLQGRVTLNPLAHLDPIGSLVFLLFGFGWGKPVVYNPLRLKRRVDELLIALAGPISNLLLAIVLNIIAHFLPNHSNNPYDILNLASHLNILLASFNIIPIPPLDGSSIVAYFWPEYRSIVGGQIGFILILLVIFVPIGGGNLLGLVVTPIQQFFTQISTLFGLLWIWFILTIFLICLLLVAKKLIGMYFISFTQGVEVMGKIIETEAYLSENDFASHSYKGMTTRNAAMFGEPGTLYLYRIRITHRLQYCN